jgi:hypothetical protein
MHHPAEGAAWWTNPLLEATMVTFGSVSLPLTLVIVVGVLLTIVSVASFSFISRGIVYEIFVPVSSQRLHKRTRTRYDRSRSS